MPIFLNLFTYEQMSSIKMGFAFEKCILLIDTEEHQRGDFVGHIDVPITMCIFKEDSDDFQEFVLREEHLG